MFEDFIIEDIFNETSGVGTEIEQLKLKEGERRNVSVLFADIKGFTSLSEKLDSEQVQNLLDTLLKAFTFCINKYGGYVDKYEGDLVMALFGAKKATEQDTKRSIYCALEMLEQLNRFNHYLINKPAFSSLGINLGVRIGINTGLVVTGKVGQEREGDFTVYGDTVNVASRMESNAPLNSVMLPHATMKLVEDDFIFEDYGEIEVKGKSKPIKVYIVNSVNETYNYKASKSLFIGRDKEFKKISNHYDAFSELFNSSDNAKKTLQFINIIGEAGLGKTRFLNEFVQQKIFAVNDQATYLHGKCTSLSQIPYYLFINIIKRYLNILNNEPEDLTKRKLDATYNDLCIYAGNEDEKLQLDQSIPLLGFLLNVKYKDERLKLKGKELQLHLQLALKSFIILIARKAKVLENKPLLIVLEDLQWNDENSEEFIKFLFNTISISENPDYIYFIFINRPEYKLSADIITSSEAEQITLPELTKEQTLKLIYSILGEIDIPDNVQNSLLERAHGNPLYIEEWVQIINNKKYLDPRRRRLLRTNKIPLPKSLQSLFLSRIDALESDLKILLQIGSVIGKSFNINILRKVQNVFGIQGNIEESLGLLVELEILNNIQKEEIEFKHLLHQEVAYHTLLDSNKKNIHKVIGEVIENEYRDNIEDYYYHLADHFYEANHREKAVKYLPLAAFKAAEEYANEKSISYYTNLISILEEKDFGNDFLDALVKRGEIYRYSGKNNEAEKDFLKALPIAEHLNDNKQIGLIFKYLGYIHFLRRNSKEAIDFTNKSIEIWNSIDDKEQLSKAMGNLGMVYVGLVKDIEAAEKIFLDKIKVDQEINYNKGISVANINLAAIYNIKGKTQDALQILINELDKAKLLQDKRIEVTISGNIAIIYSKLNDFEKSTTYLEKTIKFSQNIGYKKVLPKWYLANVYSYLEQKNYDLAKKYATKCIDLSEDLGRIDTLVEGMLMYNKVIFIETKNPHIIHETRILLKTAQTELEKAKLHYEIWKMCKELNYDLIEFEKHKNAALKFYSAYYKKTKDAETKYIVENLKA